MKKYLNLCWGLWVIYVIAKSNHHKQVEPHIMKNTTSHQDRDKGIAYRFQKEI